MLAFVDISLFQLSTPTLSTVKDPSYLYVDNVYAIFESKIFTIQCNSQPFNAF